MIQNDDLHRMGPDEAMKFLSDSGLLFEINRSILHPYGLALMAVVEVQEDGSEKIRFAGLLDYRDDPEGIIFTPETYELGERKLKEFYEQNAERFQERMERLGFIVQCKADPLEKEVGE